MKTAKADISVSDEQIEHRIAEFRRLGFARNLPAQVVYQDPNIKCPWPGCDLRINAIQFHLEHWPKLKGALLESWWRGPGLVGRCPQCGNHVLFGLTEKSLIREAEHLSSALLPDDWKDVAYIVSKPAHADVSST